MKKYGMMIAVIGLILCASACGKIPPAPGVTPSVIPSVAVSVVPSVAPSVIPSATPSVAPSALPSVAPSVTPSVVPSVTPSVIPSVVPSVAPSILPSVTPSALPESQGLAFTLNEQQTGYLVSGMGSCTDAVLYIPKAHLSLPVVGVSRGAFQETAGITKVVFPEGLTHLESYSFMNSADLTEVVFPATLTEIGSYSFAGCPLTVATFTGGTSWRAVDTVYGGMHTKTVYVTDSQNNADMLTGFYVQHRWVFLR